MYLAQTNLEIDTTQVYLLDGQEVYLTKPTVNTPNKLCLCTKNGFELLGRDVKIYGLDYQRKRKLVKVN